jgi:hypothetical protein
VKKEGRREDEREPSRNEFEPSIAPGKKRTKKHSLLLFVPARSSRHEAGRRKRRGS